MIREMKRFVVFIMLMLLMAGVEVRPAHAAITCGTPPADHAAHWTATLDATDALGCHDGALMGSAAFALGLAGTAFSLDGVDDYVSIPDHSLWTLGASSFSISFMFNLDSSCDPCFFVGADEGGGAQNKWIIYLSDGNLTFHVNFDGAASGTDIVSESYSPTTGEWHHVAVTRVGDLFSLFTDGMLLASNTDSTSIPDPTASLTIGQAEGIGYVDGRMDEIDFVKGL
jgi:uncharacterized protein